MDAIPLTEADLLSHTHNLLKPCLEIRLQDTPYSADFLAAFEAATCLIAPAINHPKFLFVVVGCPPFELQVGHHKMLFQQSATVFGTHMKGIIFLNFPVLRRYNLKLMTAAVLEEFVHALMNINDESLVQTVVGFLLQKGDSTAVEQ